MWLGKPLPPLSFSHDFNGYESSWTSSLDYRSKKETVFIADYGGLDQGPSNWIANIDHHTYQRPALLHIRRNNKGYYAI